MKNLKELSLSLSRLENKDLSMMSSSFENGPTSLEKLHLTLSTKDRSLELGKFGYSIITSFKNLRELKLNFINEIFMDKEVFIELGYVLQGFGSLNRLALRFSGIESSNKFNIAELIPKFSKLESFELFVPNCLAINDQVLQEFSDDLCKYQSKLKLLRLRFSKCSQITCKSFEKLCWDIEDSMKELNQLWLNFHGCFQIGQESKNQMRNILEDVPLVRLY